MKFFIIAALFMAAFTSPVIAERTPRTADKDGRVLVVYYNPTDVVQIYTKLKTVTAVELAKGEFVESLLVGDSSSYEIDVLSSRNVISIKPVMQNATGTNMTVYTSRRTYSFYIRNIGKGRPMYRVTFRYPASNIRTSSLKRKQNSIARKTRSVSYGWAGSASLKPIQVWNNGEATFFAFNKNVRPAVFRVGANGKEMLVNSTTKGDYVRVTGVAQRYTVRLGDEWVSVAQIKGKKVVNLPLSRELIKVEGAWLNE